MLKSINPYNQSPLEEFEFHSDTIIDKKLKSASQAFTQWRKTSFAQRSNCMMSLAKLLRQKKEEYARTITLEMGKVLKESIAEIEKCAGACEYYSQNAERLLSDQLIATEAKKSYVHYQPVGAVLAIMPWNFPFQFALGIQTSNLISESLVGLITPATRQKAGNSL